GRGGGRGRGGWEHVACEPQAFCGVGEEADDALARTAARSRMSFSRQCRPSRHSVNKRPKLKNATIGGTRTEPRSFSNTRLSRFDTSLSHTGVGGCTPYGTMAACWST